MQRQSMYTSDISVLSDALCCKRTAETQKPPHPPDEEALHSIAVHPPMPASMYGRISELSTRVSSALTPSYERNVFLGPPLASDWTICAPIASMNSTNSTPRAQSTHSPRRDRDARVDSSHPKSKSSLLTLDFQKTQDTWL
jgi:hypothetical protein